MRNAGLGETQAGIKIAGRNISNLRYADDTILMGESEGIICIPISSERDCLVALPAESVAKIFYFFANLIEEKWYPV